MENAARLKNERRFFIINVLVWVVLLGIGIPIEILFHVKAIVAISFIPFVLAITSFFKMRRIQKNPYIYAEEFDERLVADRNRADALSLRIIRYILSLAFMAYTFAYPEQIFESLNWWFVLVISMLTVLLPVIIMGNVNKHYQPDNN
jgi:hypothetical protein